MVHKESGSAAVVPVQIQWFSQGASIRVAALSPTVLWLARSYMERKELNTKVWLPFFFQNSSGRGVHCSNQKRKKLLEVQPAKAAKAVGRDWDLLCNKAPGTAPAGVALPPTQEQLAALQAQWFSPQGVQESWVLCTQDRDLGALNVLSVGFC